MNTKRWVWAGLAIGSVAGLGYALWQRSSRRPDTPTGAFVGDQATRLLERAAHLIRLPACPGLVPEVLPDGAGLRCPGTGTVFPYRAGILDLLGDDTDKTFTQRFLDTPLTAWLYDRFRGQLTRALHSPDFAEEVARIQATLQVRPGDVILDLACGHGNFTVEWAKRVGPDGLVIGLDISSPMLSRAASRVHAWGLENVLFVRGDALCLPFADGSLRQVNCSGGFHQLPNLPRALREIDRVSAPGGVLTASTLAQRPADPYARLKLWMGRRFDLYFVPLKPLGEHLSKLGYVDYTWSLPGGWFGYTSARKG